MSLLEQCNDDHARDKIVRTPRSDEGMEAQVHQPFTAQRDMRLEESSHDCDERLVQQVILYILFDLVQFYEDLVRLYEEKSKIDFSGEVGAR